MDRRDLRYTYENSEDFGVLPTFAVLVQFLLPQVTSVHDCPGIPEFNPMLLLHGEHKLTLFKSIPTEGHLRVVSKIRKVEDKGSGALVNIQLHTYDADTGELLTINEPGIFVRGIGGFLPADRKSAGSSKPSVLIPDKEPDFVYTKKTSASQAILYRLTGDRNPLHIDPDMAAVGGFERPILHGLCTFGIAGHGIIKEVCDNEPAGLRSIEGRFSSPVVPGQSLRVEMFKGNSKETILFQVRTVETGKICLSNGVAQLNVPTNAKL
nr:hydroxysteroid 17-beta dehydrogenase 4 [Nephromyces sp. MMRI]